MNIRPPFVRFEIGEAEDREASIAAGHYVSKEIINVKVTQIGSSDTFVAEATGWLANVLSDARAEPPRVPMEWYRAWKESYEAFKNSQELPLNGTPLRSWPPISSAQYQRCAEMGCLTVEDLAELTEDGIARLGMGARALKERAATWLKAATDVGKVVEQNQDLAQRLAAAEERMRSLESQIAASKVEVKTTAASPAPATAKA